jgi:hypothetical protein
MDKVPNVTERTSMNPSVLPIAYLAMWCLLAMLFFWLTMRGQNTEVTLGTEGRFALREGQTILGIRETTESMCFYIGKIEEHVHDEDDV